jgi:outer membrane protein assembly factor BamB
MAERDASSRSSRSAINRRKFLSQSVGAGLGLASLIGASDGVQAQSNGGERVWSFAPDGGWGHHVYGSPTVVNETVYFGIWGEGSDVYALDANDGGRKWKWTVPNGSIGSSPNVVNGTVYVGSNDGTLYAVDADSATTEWQFDINTSDQVFSSPTVWKGTVYVGSGNSDSTLYAVNALTGEKEWEYTDIGGIFSSPLVYDGTVYIGSNADDFHAVDATTGEREWVFDVGGDVRSSPTVANGTIYIGSRDNRLYALDAETGIEKWSFLAGGDVVSSPTVLGGTVYVGSKDGFVYAIDTETGEREWGTDTGDTIRYSSPTVTDSLVIVASAVQDGRVYAFDRASGEQQWSIELETGYHSAQINSSPIVVDGIVYVGAQSSDSNTYQSMYAIDAGVDETSKGSRVGQGVLGHHNEWAEAAASTEPVADAGEPQTVDAGEDTPLDGTGSADPTGKSLDYSWVQIAGPEVTLSDADTEIATFTAPEVTSTTDLQFELTVDNGKSKDTDSTTVTVAEQAPPPIVGDNPPQDLDDDGLYEDINGDGEFDIVDVQAFLQNLERFQSGGDLEEYAAAVDFNQDGEVDIIDVQKMLLELD